MSHSHRPSSLKQSNKAYKSKHASKGSLKERAKGRINGKSGSSNSGSHSASAAAIKANRRNTAKQLQAAKRSHLVQQAKLRDVGQKIVAVVQLTQDIHVASSKIVEALQDSLDSNAATFLTPPYDCLIENLDAIASSDFVVLAISSSVEVEAYGETLLRSLISLGVSDNAIKAIYSTQNAETPEKHVKEVKNSLTSYINHFFPTFQSHNKLYDIDSASDAKNLARSFKEVVPKEISWRENRARVLQEEPLSFNSDAEDGSKGTLGLTGTIRGFGLSANRLVHIQGYGDYQIDKIVAAPSARDKRKHASITSMDVDAPQILSEPVPSECDSLVSRNEPSPNDLLGNEQTWPTEEEIASAPANSRHAAFGMQIPDAAEGTTPKRIRRVPMGTSEYQAAWLELSDDDGSDVDEEDDMQDANGHGEQDGAGDEHQDDLEMHSEAPTGTGATTQPHHDLPEDLEASQYESYKILRDQERENLEFPDEVDTPLEGFAKERFQKYRGLKSFKQSSWDPYENLPADYSRIFMFGRNDWKIMGRKLETKSRDEGIEPGARVTVYLKNVPASIMSSTSPITIFSLHKHEHKYSVLNMSVTRNTENESVIRSKTPLILQMGFRRYAINPVFSSTNNKSSNNVHKFERFLKHGNNLNQVATAYLPITFGANVPCILFQQSQDTSQLDLVGSGTLLGVDPTRIIAKRIILTGHPYKVHKKTATIRYMFFNSEDVSYYKPIELKTKKGKIGHIKESLGTHGYYKAHFDNPIDQMDTICLYLYKRCYPKWGEIWKGDAPSRQIGDGQKGDEVDDVEMA